MIVPACKLVNQICNLPDPLPIREPLGLRVNGKCGNVLNQKDRLVRSDFREVFLRNIYKRKICLLVKRRGCRRRNPLVPNDKVFNENAFTWRFF